MLYNSSGSLILDESVTPPFSLVNNGWYFIAALIEQDSKRAVHVVGDRGTGVVWVCDSLTWTGELNRSCEADLIMGMHADQYYYVGGFDDWFLRGSLRVMEGQIKFHGIRAVDLAGVNNVKGVLQYRLPCAVFIQDHRAGKAQLFIRSLGNIVELDFLHLRCTGRVAYCQGNAETHILPVRGLQLAAGPNRLPARPFLQIVGGGSFNQVNGGCACRIFVGNGYQPNLGYGAGRGPGNKLPASRIIPVRAFSLARRSPALIWRPHPPPYPRRWPKGRL